MGIGASKQEFSTSGLIRDFYILNLFKRINFTLLVALFACFAINASAQNLDFLSEQIRSGDTEQKRSALYTIRNLENEQASRIATPSLKDDSEIVRATAAYSVIFLSSDEAASALLPNLADKSPLVRRETAYALGEVGNVKAVNSLLTILQKDKILEVRAASAVALGKIGDVSAIDELSKILQRKPSTKEEFLRRSAARSIGNIAEHLRNLEAATYTPEDTLSINPIEAEKKDRQTFDEKYPFFRTAVQTLIQSLQNPREFDDVRRESAFALGAIGNVSATPILQANADAEDYYLAEISRSALIKISIYNAPNTK